MLTVNRLKLPAKLRRSLACTNSIENMMGTVRRVCRNVKRWQNTAMATALDGGRHDGSGQGLPPFESLPAAPNPQSGACRSRGRAAPSWTLNPNRCRRHHSQRCLPALFNKKWGIPVVPFRVRSSKTRFRHKSRYGCCPSAQWGDNIYSKPNYDKATAQWSQPSADSSLPDQPDLGFQQRPAGDQANPAA